MQFTRAGLLSGAMASEVRMWLTAASSGSRSPLGYFSVPAGFALVVTLGIVAFAQRQQLPYLDAGRDSVFAQLDFAEMYLAAQARDPVHILDQDRVASGSVSLLDLAAPEKAVQYYNRGLRLLKERNSTDAIRQLQKAITTYPHFVSAHNALGLALLDQHQEAPAKAEFEASARLDGQFPASFLNLGTMALWAGDFSTATSDLEKAAALRPANVAILSALAFAQNGNHQYPDTLRTVERIHKLNHRGNAAIHYLAASAAQSLHDIGAMQQQLNVLLAEDPSNALAPLARKALDALRDRATNAAQPGNTSTGPVRPVSAINVVQTFPNSEHLRAELNGVSASTDAATCDGCDLPPDLSPSITVEHPSSGPTYATWDKVFTIHQAVDETAQFFAVSHHGHMVNDLSLSDLQIRDDNRPPARILQFIPQSKLPLRLALLIDTSGSVEHRLQFEKRAAKKFLQKVLNGSSDLAFVAAFNKDTQVSEDFTNDTGALASGVENLTRIGDGTAVFDAIYFACWKLAAFPEEGRVAKVLILLTDGEDNSSHKSLQQSIDEAEAAGVTIYTVNTSDITQYPTDASDVLQVLAERSGGESIAPTSLRALDGYLAQLSAVIRSRYLVAYRPADFIADGRYRTIRIIATKDGTRLQVHARKGYYARLAANPSATVAFSK